MFKDIARPGPVPYHQPPRPYHHQLSYNHVIPRRIRPKLKNTYLSCCANHYRSIETIAIETYSLQAGVISSAC